MPFSTGTDWSPTPESGRRRSEGTALSQALAVNYLWCAFKREFEPGDARYCYPLTVTDQASRFLIVCEASNRHASRAFWMPSTASLSTLRLGLSIARIRPELPQQNSRHKRMPLTLQKETTLRLCRNIFQQQARFNAFISDFNRERPHEALDMTVPADIYIVTPRPYGCLRSNHLCIRVGQNKNGGEGGPFLKRPIQTH